MAGAVTSDEASIATISDTSDKLSWIATWDLSVFENKDNIPILICRDEIKRLRLESCANINNVVDSLYTIWGMFDNDNDAMEKSLSSDTGLVSATKSGTMNVGLSHVEVPKPTSVRLAVDRDQGATTSGIMSGPEDVRGSDNATGVQGRGVSVPLVKAEPVYADGALKHNATRQCVRVKYRSLSQNHDDVVAAQAYLHR